MLAVARTHHTNYRIAFKPRTPARVIRFVRQRFGQYIEEHNKPVEYKKTALHKEISSSMTPGDYLHELRTAAGLTMAELGKKIGVSAPRISDFESSRRGIPKSAAKKFAEIFGVSPALFI